MAKTPTIVEFYGLPGCGKSTLCEALIQDETLRTVWMSDVTDRYRNESWLKRFSYIPWKSWLKCAKYMRSVPQVKGNGWGLYRPFFTISLAYSYFHKKFATSGTILLIDHGLVQCFASLAHNLKFDVSDKAQHRFAAFYQSIGVDMPVFCQIAKEETLNRIRTRKRSVGRIDVLMNEPEKALKLLDKEVILFEQISSVLEDSVIHLDMSGNVSDIMDRFMVNFNENNQG